MYQAGRDRAGEEDWVERAGAGARRLLATTAGKTAGTLVYTRVPAGTLVYNDRGYSCIHILPSYCILQILAAMI
eukprot:3306160-Rhodomonas_salina.1